MKITQVMLAKGFGGAERLFVDLCLTLAEFGEDVQAICAKGSESAQILERHSQIQLNTIKVFGTWDPFSPGKICQLLQLHRTQVVQAHLARGAYLAGKACRNLGLPLVVTTHNYINTKYYKHVTVLIPPTKDQYEFYLNKRINHEQLKIIKHFSPIEAIDNPFLSDPPILRIVTLGRLVEKKGFHILLSAFAKLQEKSDQRCELLIGGAGPEKQNLMLQIDSLGLKENVSLEGWIGDIEGFLKEANLFVLPSLDEPFGIVVLEAMALGIPIVSSDSKGPKEILDDETAWLFKTGDVDSLALKLQLAVDDHVERFRKSENALRVFKQNYSKQVVVPEFIQLFNSLLAAK